MKHLLLTTLLAVLSIGAFAQPLQTPDTVWMKSDRYYYSSWYNECVNYQDPPLNYTDRRFFQIRNLGALSDIADTLLMEDFTPTPLQIFGLAVMIPRVNQPYSSDTNRIAETLILYQADASAPGGMRVVDSVRWDTAAQPKLMLLPPNDLYPDSIPYYLKCSVHEFFFKEPVTVDSTFYITGTYLNNDYRIQDPQHIETRYEFVYPIDGFCDSCRAAYRNIYIVYVPEGNVYSEWNQWRHQVFGPFMAIIDPTAGLPRYRVEVIPNNIYWGSVEGDGYYFLNETATLTATPADSNYRFVSWDDGTTANPRTLVVSGDTSITALFAPANAVITDVTDHPIDFTVAPNPAHSTLTVHTATAEHYRLTLYDNNGRTCRQHDFHGTDVQLNVSQLSSGHYLLVLASPLGTGVKQIVIQ